MSAELYAAESERVMIKGLKLSMAQAGRIKIGGLGETRKASSGREYQLPVKHDHFTITTDTRDESGNFAPDERLMAALVPDYADEDGKLRRLPVVLHSDEVDEVFPSTYALYAGRKLACRGDGEEATRWEIVDGKRTGRSKSMECPCPLLESNQCKPHGTFHCSIRAEGASIAGAVHKWRTTSIVSIQRMLSSLEQIKATIGTLRGLPLILVLQPVVVSPDGANSSTVYCCHLELHAADMLSVQQQALELARMRKAVQLGDYDHQRYRSMLELPAGDDESDDEQGLIADEFAPEMRDMQPPPLPGNGHRDVKPGNAAPAPAQTLPSEEHAAEPSPAEPPPEPTPAPALSVVREEPEDQEVDEVTAAITNIDAELEMAGTKDEILSLVKRVQKLPTAHEDVSLLMAKAKERWAAIQAGGKAS